MSVSLMACLKSQRLALLLKSADRARPIGLRWRIDVERLPTSRRVRPSADRPDDARPSRVSTERLTLPEAMPAKLTKGLSSETRERSDLCRTHCSSSDNTVMSYELVGRC